MDERAARKHMRELGIGPIVKNRQWLNAGCPLAPYSPAHRSGQDSNPSFGVITEAGKQSRYFCFTCKATGTLWELAANLGRLRGKDYRHISRQAFLDDIVSLSAYDDVDDAEDDLREPLDPATYADLYEPAWQFPEARAYLKDRGVGPRTARLLGIGYDSDESRVVFPVRDNNSNLYGFSGRSILPDDQFPDKYPKVKDYLGLPKRHLLLGEERAEAGKPFLVVEGLMGYARLVEEHVDDIVNVVATMGSEMTDAKAERLVRWGEHVYLLPDPDEAGDTMLWGRFDDSDQHRGGGAVDKLKDEVPLYIPDYPKGVDDVDDLTKEDVQRMLDETQLY